MVKTRTGSKILQPAMLVGIWMACDYKTTRMIEINRLRKHLRPLAPKATMEIALKSLTRKGFLKTVTGSPKKVGITQTGSKYAKNTLLKHPEAIKLLMSTQRISRLNRRSRQGYGSIVSE